MYDIDPCLVTPVSPPPGPFTPCYQCYPRDHQLVTSPYIAENWTVDSLVMCVDIPRDIHFCLDINILIEKLPRPLCLVWTCEVVM